MKTFLEVYLVKYQMDTKSQTNETNIGILHTFNN